MTGHQPRILSFEAAVGTCKLRYISMHNGMPLQESFLVSCMPAGFTSEGDIDVGLHMHVQVLWVFVGFVTPSCKAFE